MLLQQPVSQVRILPGAPLFSQLSDGFQMSAHWSWLVWSAPWSVIVWHQMTHVGRRWGTVSRSGPASSPLIPPHSLSPAAAAPRLERLGYRFTPDQIPLTVDYYLGRTSNGSTLSGVVHTWVLARANRDRALEMFQQVLKSDVSDIQGGTPSEGIHLAAMAGSVDLMQRCFSGIETRGDRIILSPHWPETLGVLAFPILYRGLHLHLRISGKGAIISVDPRDAHGVEVECHGHVVQLTPGTTVRFPG